MRQALCAILGIALVACSSVDPVPIRAGDVCIHCKHVVTDPRLGAELIADDGTISKFESAVCLAEYLAGHGVGDVSIYVTDYSSGEFFPVANAMFVRAKDARDDGGERHFHAFKSPQDAKKFAEDHGSGVVDWAMVRQLSAKSKKKIGA
jgi:copper chaperone NosL